MSEIVKAAHELILTTRSKEIAIDATCGNGYDTLFLLKHFQEVYAFDIQSLAIKRTRSKTEGYKNLKLINSDFVDIDKYLNRADAIIFNLGFLPGSNKKVKTSDYNSSQAILNAYRILNKGGVMSIASYTKHEGGMEEFQKIENSLINSQIPYTLVREFNNGEILIKITK